MACAAVRLPRPVLQPPPGLLPAGLVMAANSLFSPVRTLAGPAPPPLQEDPVPGGSLNRTRCCLLLDFETEPMRLCPCSNSFKSPDPAMIALCGRDCANSLRPKINLILEFKFYPTKNINFDSSTTKDKIIFGKFLQKTTNIPSTPHKIQEIFW